MKLVGYIEKRALEEARIVKLDYPPFDVAVVLTDTGTYAIEDACNHASASLSEGWVEDECLICPVHQYAFDLATGALVRPKGLCADQRKFVVREEGEKIGVYDPFSLVIVG